MKKFWKLLLNDITEDKERLTKSFDYQFNHDGYIKTAYEYPYSKLRLYGSYPLNDEYKSSLSEIFERCEQCDTPYNDNSFASLKESCPDEILELFKNIVLSAIHDDRFYVPLDGCNFVLRKDWMCEPCIYIELTLKLKEGKKITLKEVQPFVDRSRYSDDIFYTKD